VAVRVYADATGFDQSPAQRVGPHRDHLPVERAGSELTYRHQVQLSLFEDPYRSGRHQDTAQLRKQADMKRRLDRVEHAGGKGAVEGAAGIGQMAAIERNETGAAEPP
jgi:hypothetical protein